MAAHSRQKYYFILILLACLSLYWLSQSAFPKGKEEDTKTMVKLDEHSTQENDLNDTKADVYVEANRTKECTDLISSLVPPFPAILVDELILGQLVDNKCRRLKKDRQIKVAVSLSTYAKIIDKEINYTKKYMIMPYYKENNKHYVTIKEREMKRIMPTSSLCEDQFVPANTAKFLKLLRRSRLINCANIGIERNDSSTVLPLQETAQVLAQLTEFLLDYGMYASLSFGTILGWYRECSIIPHTIDTDVMVDAKDHNPRLFEDLIDGSSPYRILKKLGTLERGLEFSVEPKIGRFVGDARIYTDIFYLYGNETMSWMMGTSPDGKIVQFPLPRIVSYCAADLLDYLFWVPCNIEEVIKAAYDNWFIDVPTQNFSWMHNGIVVGQYTADEMTNVSIYYY